MGYLLDDEEEQKPFNPQIIDYFRNSGKLPAAPAVVPVQSSPLDDFSDEKRQAALADSEERQSGLGWAQFAAGMGDALAGRSSDQTAKNFEGIRKGIKDSTVGEFDKRKKLALEDYSTKRTLAKDKRDDDVLARENDLNSDETISYQDMMIRMGMDPKKARTLTAQSIKGLSPVYEKMYQIEESKKTRAEDRAQRNQEKQNKLDEKMQGLETPFGLANTVDDAKQLKEAHIAKRNFDNKLQDMIDLRTKHKGGAIMNRDDVGRGKQLSKDLLLEYKNMAKLGVLSQADENIINAIIPADPLEYNSPVAAVQGQDPILHKLKSFKSDSDEDFKTRIATRTRAGVKTAATPSNQQKTISKTQTNQRTGEKRIVYSDGSIEVVPSIAGGR